jgi:hypothetical protein
MRLPILRALLVKEARRHVANRGGIALCLLLVVAALLLSVFNPGAGAGGTGGGALVDGVHRCMVQYDRETPLVVYLKDHTPDELRPHVMFQLVNGDTVDGIVHYPPGTGAVRVRSATAGGGVRIDVWHPPGHPAAMAPYEAWLWQAVHDATHAEAVRHLRAANVDAARLTARDPADTGDLWAVRDSLRRLGVEYDRLAATPGVALPALPAVEIRRQGLGAKELDLRSAVSMGMVVFALYFFCVYLLPTMTCEERERGVLLAQALSPASPAEILAAKFLFYPVLGMALAATLAGIYKPAILGSLFFWLSILAVGSGFLGLGMTIATLARTQRAAFMGSMCYLMSVALVLFICQQNGIPGLPYLAIEYHGPRIIHAAITGEVAWSHWGNLLAAAGLGVAWMAVAGWLFRRRGWQ